MRREVEPMTNKKWNDVRPGEAPLCILGAGFSSAMLKKPLPSTRNIIEQTGKSFPAEFPMLSRLVNLYQNNKSSLCLNLVWQRIESIPYNLLSDFPSIMSGYRSLNRPMFNNFLNIRRSSDPVELLWLILGLELKKMIALQYGNHSRMSFNDSVCSNLLSFISKCGQVFWVSLNYDLVLECFLSSFISSNKQFNANTPEVQYEFTHLLTGRRVTTAAKHTVVKPHGSVNISFETFTDVSPVIHELQFIHELRFVNPSNYLEGFDWRDMGYSSMNIPYSEKRPWLVGYLPDDMKHELKSPAFYTDPAHDLCRYNIASFSLALSNASSLFILGYSLPSDDDWVRGRIANIRQKSIPVYVASRSSTHGIIQHFKSIGFTNVYELNNGSI
jgi:hypothetical protein